jgi:hypothetical protein
MKVTVHFGSTKSIADQQEFEENTRTREFATQAELNRGSMEWEARNEQWRWAV